MPERKASQISLSADKRHELLTLIRAQILLHLADGHTTHEMARRLGTSPLTVRGWRRHGLARRDGPVPERLHEAQRPGTPAIFRVEHWGQIMALACDVSFPKPPSVPSVPGRHAS